VGVVVDVEEVSELGVVFVEDFYLVFLDEVVS
jgi:hypothetical protein